MRDMNINKTKKYAHWWMGPLILALSVLGGSSLGVMSNYVDAEGPFLKNTWRFQALFFVAIFLIPFFFLYDRYYLKYERYRAYLRELEQKQINLKQGPSQPKSYEEKYPRPTDESKGEDLYIIRPEEASSERFKEFEA